MSHHLRSWTASSTERTWTVVISVACFALLLTLLILSGELSTPKVKEAVKKSEPVSIVSPINVSVKPLVEKTEKKKISPMPLKEVKKAVEPVKQANANQIQITHKVKQPVSFQVYFIQVGAFHKKVYAQQMRERLAHKNWSVRIQRKKQLYAVQIGPYKNKKTAESHKNKLFQQGKMNGFIIRFYKNKVK